MKDEPLKRGPEKEDTMNTPRLSTRCVVMLVSLLSMLSMAYEKSTGSHAQEIVAEAETPATQTISTWAHAYGGGAWDEFRCIQQTTDEGFIAAGCSNSFGAGGYDAWVVKLNSHGEVQWQKTYGTNRDEQAYWIIQTQDGGYAFTGYVNSGVNKNLWVVKVDQNGLDQWQKEIYREGDDWADSIAETSEGDFILGGASNGGDRVWFIKLNSVGALVMQRAYDIWNSISHQIIPTQDGGFIAALEDTYWKVLIIVKLNANGTIAWSKHIDPAKTILGWSIRNTPDGGYLVAGDTDDTGMGGWDVFFMKVSGNGEIIWQETVGGGADDFVTSLYVLPDGSFLASGWTKSFGNGAKDAWLLKSDSSGHVQWQKSYGGGSDDKAWDLIPTSDGGYAGIGWLGQDAFAIKMDAFGNMDSSCSALSSSYAESSDSHYSMATNSPSDVGGSPTSAPTAASVADSHATDTLICFSPSCSLLCTATGPATVLAGIAAIFSASTTPSGCSNQITYDWNFGDNTHSSDQNPNHVYATPGNLTWVLNVSVDSVTCTQTGNIAVIAPPPCTLSCEAAAPSLGITGAVMSYVAASAYPIGACQGSISYEWDFGDNTPKVTQENPFHSYAAAGAYTWTMTAKVGDLICFKAGTILISNPTNLPGDCNNDGQVSIGEVQKVINIFLGISHGC